MQLLLTENQLKNLYEKVNNITKLAFFDHDGTLINVSDEEEGKRKWEEVKNKEYPHEGWWSKPESLDKDVFDLKPNSSVVQDYKERYNDPNTLCFLLTNRVSKMEPTIKELLNSYGIVMDGYYFRDNHRDKAEIIKEESQHYPNLEVIEVWDDREKELSKFRQLKNELEDVQLNIYAIAT